MDRIAQLEEFLRDDPEDAFTLYALALEYLKSDAKKSYEIFEGLLNKRPDYLPTYYPFAHLLIELQQADKAKAIFQQGIDAALRANDRKTHKELTSAYNDYLYS